MRYCAAWGRSSDRLGVTAVGRGESKLRKGGSRRIQSPHQPAVIKNPKIIGHCAQPRPPARPLDEKNLGLLGLPVLSPFKTQRFPFRLKSTRDTGEQNGSGPSLESGVHLALGLYVQRGVEQRAGRRSVPMEGDVLASRPIARADLYWISVVPAAAHLTARRYTEAIERVRELARQRQVDGWFSCNHTHYLRVAGFRR